MSDANPQFQLDQQSNGQWLVTMLDDGYIKTIADCPNKNDANASALYALAKNREYKEEAINDGQTGDGK